MRGVVALGASSSCPAPSTCDLGRGSQFSQRAGAMAGREGSNKAGRGGCAHPPLGDACAWIMLRDPRGILAGRAAHLTVAAPTAAESLSTLMNFIFLHCSTCCSPSCSPPELRARPAARHGARGEVHVGGEGAQKEGRAGAAGAGDGRAGPADQPVPLFSDGLADRKNSELESRLTICAPPASRPPIAACGTSRRS